MIPTEVLIAFLLGFASALVLVLLLLWWLIASVKSDDCITNVGSEE